MDKKLVKKIVDKTEVFLLDMDGTIYLDSTPIGDMINTLKSIRQAGKKIVYFTNNSSKTVDEYENKLKTIGFWEDGDEVYSSGVATIWYLKKYYPNKRVYLLGTDALIKTFKDNGIIIDNENPEIAVLAYDTTIDFSKIKLFNEFLVKGATYIATHPDMVCPTKDIFMPDVGSFIKMFEGSSGRVRGEPALQKLPLPMKEPGLEHVSLHLFTITGWASRLFSQHGSKGSKRSMFLMHTPQALPPATQGPGK